MNSNPAHRHFRGTVLFALLLLAASSWPRTGGAAELYIYSGRTAELQELVLAEDEAGPVTALDVLFYLTLVRRAPSNVTVEQWLAEPEERNPVMWQIIRDGTLEYLAMRSLARKSGGGDPISADLRRSFAFPGAEAAWVENIVKPQIKIEEVDVNRYYIAHRELYSTPDRAQVRYIFLPVEDMSRLDLQTEMLKQMDIVRDRIVSRELDFPAAAREYSKAPSGANGGLIPSFPRGTHFTEFEFQTFALSREGQISPSFVGNDGIYLIQLVSVQKSEKIPLAEVEGKIREKLAADLIVSYYRFLQGKLSTDYYVQDLSLFWPYSDLAAPIAVAAGRKLHRDQIYRVNPQVINANYEVQWSVIQGETSSWIEGELILHDMTKRKMANHPYIAQSTGIGETIIAARPAMMARVDRSKTATPEAAQKSLGLGGEGTPGIPQSRVIRISLTPDKAAMKEIGRAQVTRQAIHGLSEQIAKGTLPLGEDEPGDFTKTLAEAAGKGQQDLSREIKRLIGQVSTSRLTDIKLLIEDLGWKDSLPIIAWHPSLAKLKPGEVSEPQPLGDAMQFLYVAGTRLNPDSPLLEKPFLLESLAFDVERGTVIEEEVKAIEAKDLLNFEVKAPENPFTP